VKSVGWKAVAGLVNLIVVLGVAIFLPAETIRFEEGWIFLGVFGAAVLAITVYLMKYDPALLARRVKAGPVAEERMGQKVVQGVASIAFIAIFVVSGLDHRFRWSSVPLPVVALGDVLVAGGLFFVFLVFRENTFTSATIEVAERQHVVSTGPYAVIRHPMYSGALVMLLGVPLALGSWFSFPAVVPLAVAIVWRLYDEERLLEKDLDGYVEYRKTVRYRIVPYVF
jgi:protein-S-isoprenylcysteine O-methyltransferase Ste14